LRTTLHRRIPIPMRALGSGAHHELSRIDHVKRSPLGHAARRAVLPTPRGASADHPSIQNDSALAQGTWPLLECKVRMRGSDCRRKAGHATAGLDHAARRRGDLADGSAGAADGQVADDWISRNEYAFDS